MLAAILLGLLACADDSDLLAEVDLADGRPPPGAHRDALPPVTPRSPIQNGWDPDTGRGTITLTTPAGERLEIRLQDGFEGYTGGLLLGSMGGSAFRSWPTDAPAGTRGLSLWCAQDESLLLEQAERRLEYSHGWSENFGTGPDGVPLRYLGGRVLHDSPDGLLLRAENAAMPFHLARWLQLLPDGTLLTRLRISNVSEASIQFSFWEGEDPWVGDYGSSEGDVGWFAGALIRQEASLGASPGACLGMADLGDQPRAADPWPLAASFLCLDPLSPKPDQLIFANGFAHGPDEVSDNTPLSDQSPTAFNLGWTHMELAPGASWELRWAMGVALLPQPGAATAEHRVPRAPSIAPETWQALRELPAPEPSADRVRDPLRFRSEKVELEVLAGGEQVEVRGSYDFVNEGSEPLHRRIFFPFHVDEAHPYPHQVRVEGRDQRRLKDGIVFSVELEPGAEQTVGISYSQHARDGSATYILSSAISWGQPLDRAELVLITPAGLALGEASYPLGEPQLRLDKALRSTTLERFHPDREWVVRWGD